LKDKPAEIVFLKYHEARQDAIRKSSFSGFVTVQNRRDTSEITSA